MRATGPWDDPLAGHREIWPQGLGHLPRHPVAMRYVAHIAMTWKHFPREGFSTGGLIARTARPCFLRKSNWPVLGAPLAMICHAFLVRSDLHQEQLLDRYFVLHS
jgi:hypothetical protein